MGRKRSNPKLQDRDQDDESRRSPKRVKVKAMTNYVRRLKVVGERLSSVTQHVKDGDSDELTIRNVSTMRTGLDYVERFAFAAERAMNELAEDDTKDWPDDAEVVEE